MIMKGQIMIKKVKVLSALLSVTIVFMASPLYAKPNSLCMSAAKEVLDEIGIRARTPRGDTRHPLTQLSIGICSIKMQTTRFKMTASAS